jgi:maltose alpha-D-glucosyltransferase/alpha-amylase
MHWSNEHHGGFTTAKRPVRPVISDPIYGYQHVNVESQRRDPHSLLNWMERKIRMRKECPEISWGDWKILKTDQPGVLVMRYEWNKCTLITCHNFTSKPRAIVLDHAAVAAEAGAAKLVDLLARNDSRADEHGRYMVQLQPYDYRWFRAGGIDLTAGA